QDNEKKDNEKKDDEKKDNEKKDNEKKDNEKKDNEKKDNEKNGEKKEDEKKEEPAHTFTGSLTFATDYRYRGISQTMRRPTVQGYIEYGIKGGYYISLFSSNVDGTTNFYNNTSLELTTAAGVKDWVFAQHFPCICFPRWVEDLHYGFGATAITYAGGKT